jgi:hypothetical protein
MAVKAIRGNVQELTLVGTWNEKDSQDNLAATAKRVASPNKKHYITGVSASFSAAATKLLQIKDGVAVIWEGYVHNGQPFDFLQPLEITAGNEVSAVLAASGTAGVIGKVNLTGFTEL